MRHITLSVALLILVGHAAFAADERPTRVEIFDSMNGEAAPKPRAERDPAEHPPLVLPEVKHDVTITGKISPGLRLDLELQYLSTNKFHDVLIGGVGWVKEPIPKMLRPGVTYKPDGTYEIKFSMFNSSWLSGRFQLHYARIGVLQRGFAPTTYDLRADAPGAPGMFDAKSISVKHVASAGAQELSCDIVTANGSAPHRVLALPKDPGFTSYTMDVQLEP